MTTVFVGITQKLPVKLETYVPQNPPAFNTS